MRLRILTPDKIMLDTEIKGIFVEAVDGELGVLPGHIPLITALAIAPAHYITTEGETEYVTIIGGTFKVENNEITILTPLAEIGEDIDETRAKIAKDRARAELEGLKDQGISMETPEYERARIAMLKALARVKTIDRSKRR